MKMVMSERERQFQRVPMESKIFTEIGIQRKSAIFEF